MPVILIANPKGGVGKSTLSTQIAGYLAWRGHRVVLGDADVQQSSRQWVGLRSPDLPAIGTMEVDAKQVAQVPKGTTHLVLDTPAGVHGKRLSRLFTLADALLIPLQPSLFDIQATHAFVQQLAQLERELGRAPRIALVAMRAKEGTLSVQQLAAFTQQLGVPVVAQLRDTQVYVQLAARGLTLWDVAPSRVQRDLAQWAPLIEWLER